MVEVDYRQVGIDTYGHSCELCGYRLVEVHHIDYKLHDLWEGNIRDAAKAGQDITQLLEEAKGLGFLSWDGHQLSKDSRSTNLSVLCGNCHNLVHLLDAGINLLKALSPRK